MPRGEVLMFKRQLDLNRRRDLEVIAELVKQGDRVLDLGCGDGSFLRKLRETSGAEVFGVEIDQELIAKCVTNGVPVIQRDLDDNLDFAADDSFDLVVLSQTLQEMRRPDRLISCMMRVGKRVAVSVINFGHWSCRLQLMFSGQMPRNSQMPYHWYDTPNIHFSTINDFRELCESLDVKIVQETPLPARFPRLTAAWPNMFAIGCVFVLEKK
jgi:methionine biosynthesis protein MetW